MPVVFMSEAKGNAILHQRANKNAPGEFSEAFNIQYWETVSLEISMTWRTWEWYHVADVSHACHKQQQTFEAETKACMRT